MLGNVYEKCAWKDGVGAAAFVFVSLMFAVPESFQQLVAMNVEFADALRAGKFAQSDVGEAKIATSNGDVVFVAYCAATLLVLRAAVNVPVSRIPKAWIHKDSNHEKLIEEVFACLWHSMTMYVELTLMSSSSWFDGTFFPWRGAAVTDAFWEGQPAAAMSLRFRVLHIWALGWYCHDLFAFFFVDRPKDLAVMTAHHVMTVLLISLSFFSGWYRIGTAIMVLHRICDVSFSLCKAIHYLKFAVTAQFGFVLMLASWFYSRLVVFPALIVFSVYLNPNAPSRDDHFLIPLGKAFCLALVGLHIKWFIQLLRVAKGALGTGEFKEEAAYGKPDKSD